MAPTVAAPHPSWCDPRTCTADAWNVDHRAEPISWKTDADDVTVAVGLSRFDELGSTDGIGHVRVHLAMHATVIHDDPTESHLSPTDARLLAAALIAAAERADVAVRAQATASC